MYLNGDLNQMASQKRFLISRGFDIGQDDVYPVVKKNEEKKALFSLWINKVNGWWCYKEEFIKYKICTEQEYFTALES